MVAPSREQQSSAQSARERFGCPAKGIVIVPTSCGQRFDTRLPPTGGGHREWLRKGLEGGLGRTVESPLLPSGLMPGERYAPQSATSAGSSPPPPSPAISASSHRSS